MTEPSQTTRANAPDVSGHDHASGVQSLADRMGIGVSLGCAVHCAATGALSIAPSFGSILGGPVGEGSSITNALEWMETPFLAVALLVGLYALVPAYRHEHGNPQPLGLFLIGAAQLVSSRFVEGPMEIGVTVMGVAFIATAHLVNLRACARLHRASTPPVAVASDGHA
ncbi:MAG: MerC domain-containing protein [Deltaproteobacteria bacterium]|nr:MerC domain-containing protein [Deltaproteobacteria bacterium]